MPAQLSLLICCGSEWPRFVRTANKTSNIVPQCIAIFVASPWFTDVAPTADWMSPGRPSFVDTAAPGVMAGSNIVPGAG